MRFKIGKNIKKLRLEKEMTQKELAGIVGVSFQTLSKWEHGYCYPDIEYLPKLALFFGVSIDSLFSVEEYDDIISPNLFLNNINEALSAGNIDEAIEISREAVSKFPNDFTLLNNLMYALFISGGADGNIENYRENQIKYDKEIIALGEYIVDKCQEQDIRNEVIARLALYYCDTNRISEGRKLYEKLPCRENCRENNIWYGLKKEERKGFLHSEIKETSEYLSNVLMLLAANDLEYSDEEVIIIYEKILQIDKIIYENWCQGRQWELAYTNILIARKYALSDKCEEMCKALHNAFEYAYSYDNEETSDRYECLLLKNDLCNSGDVHTNDDRKCMEVLKNKWLESKEFKKYKKMIYNYLGF